MRMLAIDSLHSSWAYGQWQWSQHHGLFTVHLSWLSSALGWQKASHKTLRKMHIGVQYIMLLTLKICCILFFWCDQSHAQLRYLTSKYWTMVNPDLPCDSILGVKDFWSTAVVRIPGIEFLKECRWLRVTVDNETGLDEVQYYVKVVTIR